MNNIDIHAITLFQDKILAWYFSNGRNFLWREENRSHYEIIISEVLLQRTKAETVSRFYPNFIIKYPTWEALNIATIEQLEDDLKPVGLYKQRAKRVKALALELYERNGTIPTEREELDKMSMVGQYIANAIELQIFKRNKPLLDVNMARVLERYFGPRDLSDIRYDPYLQNLAHQIVNHEKSKQINWAILDFAALICKSKKPLCAICFLSANCKFYEIFVNN